MTNCDRALPIRPISNNLISPSLISPSLISPSLISPSWCDRPATAVAPDLIGCILARQLPNGPLIRSVIVETEAYAPDDPACHAYRGLTSRNAAMFGPPGHSYVYFIYGMYYCLNVVTQAPGIGSAVLIRALELASESERILTLQQAAKQKPHRIAAGPGKLCRALNIDRTLDGVPYHPSSGLWLEHRPQPVSLDEIVQTTRIGITKAADLPWRWYLKGSRAVSRH
jgi:DNA-3-methyladenine glycosylase